MIPAFIMTGSMIMPATWSLCSSRRRATLPRSLNAAISVRSVMALGMPVEAGALLGLSSGPACSGCRGDGDLHRVVMTVVAALDLDDQVPAGDGAHEVDGVHGGFGAGVGEAPSWQAEAAGEFLGDHDGVRGGLGEMGPLPGLVGYRFLDGRVGVAGQGSAVAAVQVDVLVAVDVPDLRAAAVAQPDRLRRGDLPARGDTAGEVALGLLWPGVWSAAGGGRRSPPAPR